MSARRRFRGGAPTPTRRAGATELLEGQLIPSDSGMTLEIRRVELRTGIVTGVYQVTAADRYAVVDSMTGMVANADAPRHTGWTSRRGHDGDSLMAYRFYEEGLRAFYFGCTRRRIAPLPRRTGRGLVVRDGRVGTRHASSVLRGTPDGRHGTLVTRNALRLAQRAPERERLTITAKLLGDDGEPAAVAVAESLATRYPEDPRALMTLSKVQSASGHFAAAVASAERAVALDSQAMIAGRR